MKNFYLQQGDTLYYPETLPEGLNKLDSNVVQEGESTGHAHRLHGEGYELFQEPKTKVKYLRVVQPVDLRHEEHKPFIIPPGTYRIGIVREYNHFDEEARQVVD